MKLRLIEETDYLREGENLVHFSKTFHSPWIVFPKYFKEYSNSKVLSMSLLEGTHLDELLKENPDQSRRDHFGRSDPFLTDPGFLSEVHPDASPQADSYLKLWNSNIL